MREEDTHEINAALFSVYTKLHLSDDTYTKLKTVTGPASDTAADVNLPDIYDEIVAKFFLCQPATYDNVAVKPRWENAYSTPGNAPASGK